MKLYLKKNGIKVAVLVLSVAVIISMSAYIGSGRAGFLSNAAAAIRSPVQRAASSVVGWLEGIYGYLYEYDQLVAENNSLRAQLADAQEKARTYADANEENERLRELLGLREKHSDFECEPAKIVDWNPSNWSSTFTISKGSSSGLELAQSVVTEYGALVGQIVEIGDTWATVRTIIDVDMDVGALVGEPGNAAMVVGDFALMQEGRMKLTFLTEGTQLSRGDIILTSGKGGMFPQGLEIGTIADILTEAGGQTPYAVLEPSCDLSTLAQVFVIKEFYIIE